MKTIHEIFKTNPDLMEEPEVKELINEFSSQFKKLKSSKYRYWDFVTDLTIHSELFLKDGIPCKDVVEKIHNASFENFA